MRTKQGDFSQKKGVMYENETGGIQSKERGNVSAYKRGGGHCDLKVHFLKQKLMRVLPIILHKNKGNNKCYTELKCTCKGLQKSISELER